MKSVESPVCLLPDAVSHSRITMASSSSVALYRGDEAMEYKRGFTHGIKDNMCSKGIVADGNLRQNIMFWQNNVEHRWKNEISQSISYNMEIEGKWVGEVDLQIG